MVRFGGSEHELLPWYVTGTLNERERETFRVHLETCAECQREKAVLERVEEQAARHGEAYFEDHPPAERLVAAVCGELGVEEESTVRRHLEICATCAVEARLVSGESSTVAAAPPARAASAARSRWAPWGFAGLGAAAATLVFLLLPPAAGPSTGRVRLQLVSPAERAAERPAATGPRRGDGPATIYFFPVDLPASGFPFSYSIVDQRGQVVYRADGVRREDLESGQFEGFECDRRDCPPGRYSILIRPSDSRLPEVRSEFEVVE